MSQRQTKGGAPSSGTESKPSRRRGRPPVKNPAETYAGKSYIVTTFRMSKRTVAEADTCAEALALGTRTSAIQLAVNQLYRVLPKLSGRPPEEVADLLRRYLKALGAEP